MDQRRLVMWAVLVGSVLFTTYTLMSGDDARPVARPAATAAATATDAPAPAATSGVAPSEAPRLTPQEHDAWRATLDQGRRDPFFTARELESMNRPAAAVAEVPPTPPARTLKLVLFSGSEPKAFIDGEAYGVGDMVGDERVVEITADTVVLERDGRQRRLEKAVAPRNPRIRAERIR